MSKVFLPPAEFIKAFELADPMLLSLKGKVKGTLKYDLKEYAFTGTCSRGDIGPIAVYGNQVWDVSAAPKMPKAERGYQGHIYTFGDRKLMFGPRLEFVQQEVDLKFFAGMIRTAAAGYYETASNHNKWKWPDTGIYALQGKLMQTIAPIIEAYCNTQSLQIAECNNCHNPFFNASGQSKFCSSKCRTANHRKKKGISETQTPASERSSLK